MSTTARTHFDEDIARAMALRQQAQDLATAGKPERLVQDMRIAAMAMAVGAMDAYFCDKYVDCLTKVLRAYARGEWTGKLPANYARERLPAGQVLDASRAHRPAWGIRMAARNIMERDNMLSISRVDAMFNPILPNGSKIWADFIPKLLAFGSKRLTGPKTATEITALTGKDKEKATKKAIQSVKDRLGEIIQIRHDWIHNCARPKVAIATYTDGQAKSRIRDVKRFVQAFDDFVEANRRV